MSARTLQSDSGGVTRQSKRIPLEDSGGVTRIIKRILASDAGGVTRLVFTGADFLTLVTASAPVGGSNGYEQGGFGSLTPTTLGDGSTVTAIAASVTTPFALQLSITGYPGTITSSYLTSLSLNGNVFLQSSASFSGGGAGGTALWTWNPGFHFSASETVAVVLQRNT
jgi:hypothetical protein